MTPDSIDTRVGRLEQTQAVHGERLDTIAHRLDGLGLVPERMAGMEYRLTEMANRLGKMQADTEAREDQTSKERKDVRIALITLSGVIFTSVLGFVGVVISQVV